MKSFSNHCYVSLSKKLKYLVFLSGCQKLQAQEETSLFTLFVLQDMDEKQSQSKK